MPDQNATQPNTTDPAAPAAGATTTPAAPPATATPAAPPAQPARPAAAKAKPAKGGKPNKNEIVIPANAFKDRIRREAQALVQQATGLPFDRVKELVAQAGVQAGGGGRTAAQNTAEASLSKLRQELEKANKERERLRREGEDREKKHKKELRRAQDRAIEAELGAIARAAGIIQPRYIKFAIDDFAREVQKNPDLKPEAFFAGLKATDPGFFQAAAPPPPPPTVAATTAPPESPAQGETRPAPIPAGAPPEAPNVDNMSDADFAAHRRNTYGFQG